MMMRIFGKRSDISLNEIADWEIAKGVTKLNGQNNKKVLPRSKWGTWEWTYDNTGR